MSGLLGSLRLLIDSTPESAVAPPRGGGPARRKNNPQQRRRALMRTLAIRLEEDTHAQLMLMSRLNGMTITDIIRASIEVHLADLAAQPDVAAKAESLTAEIEREATEQRNAIQALLRMKQPTDSKDAIVLGHPGGRKTKE